ncbi:MAG: hypothetical protein KatS3mg054_0658 [Chloroflexus sp.]|nr:MAG: hypothetical protein KatS3mg054_0658 [Chloroflexus sp.]
MVREAIVALLRNNPSVSALVGTRIYPLVVPPDVAKPAIAYQVISESRGYIMTGQDGITNTRIQLTIVANSVTSADAVGRACHNALSGYSGQVGSTTIYLITHANEYDTQQVEGDELRVLRQDYQVKWKEN